MLDRGDYMLINNGLRLYASQDAWDAHEQWEVVWKRTEGPEQAVLQVLIQTAAAVHKHQQGTPAGVTRNLEKAIANIARANGRPSCMGLDLVALEARLRRSLASMSTGSFIVPKLPERTGPDGFIYLHGFASSPRSFKASHIVPDLQARGWSVDTPDLNQDDFAGLTISRALSQVRRHLRDRTIIIGSSLGGYIAALLQEQDPRVVATVLMAPAFEFVERLRSRHGDEALRAWEEQGGIEVEHYGYRRMARIDYTLVSDAEKYPGRPRLRVPTFVLQGRRDDVVPASMVAHVVAQAPAGLVTYDEVDDDHALRDTVDRARNAAEEFGTRFDFASDAALTS